MEFLPVLIVSTHEKVLVKITYKWNS